MFRPSKFSERLQCRALDLHILTLRFRNHSVDRNKRIAIREDIDQRSFCLRFRLFHVFNNSFIDAFTVKDAQTVTRDCRVSTIGARGLEQNRRTRNVTTLEDPVEYPVPGAVQVQVDPRAGLTFPAALRAVLRQDPDVVMVGEIRDAETAEIAMSAAVTGHLVLSTLHTTDAPSALTRLVQMGVPAYLVAAGVAGVVAQRLVRIRCERCGAHPGREGCPDCVDGYRGRTGVFQVLAMNDRLREAVVQGASTPVIRRLARESGMGLLADDARRQVSEGRTTPHEVARVIRGDSGSAVPCEGCGGEVPADSGGCPWCGRRRIRECRCGRRLEPGWRFCAGCLARVAGGGIQGS